MNGLVWPQDLLVASPWFSAVRGVVTQLAWQHFPNSSAWRALPTQLQPHNRRGMAIAFEDPATLDDGGYEARIFESGVVATRPDDWHDAFNALCWMAWPRTKAALNALHAAELTRQEGTLRNTVRDAATLLDESGMVLACSDTALQDALLAHDWATLFTRDERDWGSVIEPFIFGHALMEKGLAPFLGIVAKTVLVEVDADWFIRRQEEKVADLDRRLAQYVESGQLQSPRMLPPLPVLGIPGWWPCQDAAFYGDASHFRPKRDAIRQRVAVIHRQ